ncbi:MAG: hypothetical protein K2X80_12815, partial [Pseudomonadaceae bacterium]|nr:hypothetical protein [Pseudomonadaceae bacterium]
MNIYLFGYSLQGNAFGWLFTAGLLLYLPLLLVTLFYLFRYAIGLFKNRDVSAVLHLLLFALFPFLNSTHKCNAHPCINFVRRLPAQAF